MFLFLSKLCSILSAKVGIRIIGTVSNSNAASLCMIECEFIIEMPFYFYIEEFIVR
jgi:hypothetical protein